MPARKTIIALLLAVADAVAVFLVLEAAHYYRFGRLVLSGDSGVAHGVLGLSVLLAFWIGLSVAGLYDPREFRLGGLVFRRLLAVAAAAALAGGAVIFLLQQKLASRAVYAILIVGSTVAVWATRALAARVLAWRGSRAGLRTLVVGTGQAAAQVGAGLVEDHGSGAALAGYLDAGESPPRVDPDRIMGDLSALPAMLDAHVIDHVVFAVPVEVLAKSEQFVIACQEVGVDVSIVGPSYGQVFTRADVGRLGDLPIFVLRASPQFRAAMLGKRVFDLVLSPVLLLAALPLLVLTGLLVGVTSRGGVFYVQERIGLHGRPFPLVKLRTMVAGAHALQPELSHLNEQDGPAFKIKRDPRVTAIGSWLRRLSIDELPQLFNVIKGDMSLVGPRPPLASEVARYDRWQRRRLCVRPGLTGLWQVSGRNDLGFAEWMRLDLEYIDRWSFWLDMGILLRTIPAILSRRGAS